MTRLTLLLLCLLFCVSFSAGAKTKAKAGWGRRRRRWRICWDCIARAADRAARAVARAAAEVAKRAREAAERAARAVAEAARRAAAAVAEAAKRAYDASVKFVKDSFGGLLSCLTNLKKCIMDLLGLIFKPFGLPNPIWNSGAKWCLKPNGMCITLPTPTLSKPPWNWGLSLHCIDVMMMINYWMAYAKAIFNAVMGALTWFVNLIVSAVNAIVDLIMKALGALMKVMEFLMKPVLDLLQPILQPFEDALSAVTKVFDDAFDYLVIPELFNLPRLNLKLPVLSAGGEFCTDGFFTTGLDDCGIIAVVRSIKAALCSLLSLNFDTIVKAFKKGINAVVHFGKNIGSCFTITTKGMEAVFDAIPFVRTTSSRFCLKNYVSSAVVGLLTVVGTVMKAVASGVQAIINYIKGWGLSGAQVRRSNSQGDSSHVTGYKRCMAGTKEVLDPFSGAGSLDIETFLSFLNLLTSFWVFFKPTSMVVAFAVTKLLHVVSYEAGNAFHDCQFCVFVGTVWTTNLFPAVIADEAAKKPFKEFNLGGLSWTPNFGSAQYGKSKQYWANLIVLQALSINFKIIFGTPMAKRCSVPFEIKPNWLLWVWNTSDASNFTVAMAPGLQLEFDVKWYTLLGAGEDAKAATAEALADKAAALLETEGKVRGRIFAKIMKEMGQHFKAGLKAIWKQLKLGFKTVQTFLIMIAKMFSVALGWVVFVFHICVSCIVRAAARGLAVVIMDAYM